MLADLLIAVGVMCAITGVLALLVVVAEATIGDYGETEVTINGKRREVVTGGKPLLGALKDKGIFVPSACGGRGSCGLCKVTVEQGGGEALATEMPWLSESERKSGVRLACQCKVRRPMAIRIPDELFNVRQFRAQVASLRDLTHDIKEVRLRLIEPDAIDFVAGQFIQFEVPPYDLTDEPVYRAYSIASPPSVKGEVNLEIRYVPNGICTTYVHKHLKAGDHVTLNGPYGDFHLRGGEQEVICIAGGSGMAPIRSILLDMRDRGISRKVRYFFGARSGRDLFLLEEMKALESALPDFRYIPALSAPQPEDAWDGEVGLITNVVDRHLAPGTQCQAYLCGSPLMIDACVKVLHAKGVGDDRIFYDKFA
jgi:Na+-transporting NADH:ubiquinone oxidoreductase subunit F